MTVYLWGNPAIFIAAPLIALVPRLEDNPVASPIAYLAVTFALIILAVFMFGWVEDVAARRRPRLNPWPRNAVKAAARTGTVNPPPPLGQRQESSP
jgi:peptidoglycan/LPS O-acetylase OafA/YrhL